MQTVRTSFGSQFSQVAWVGNKRHSSGGKFFPGTFKERCPNAANNNAFAEHTQTPKKAPQMNG